jgi:hypothetical protein
MFCYKACIAMFPVYYSITSLPSQYTLFLEYIHNILEKDSSIFFKKNCPTMIIVLCVSIFGYYKSKH